MTNWLLSALCRREFIKHVWRRSKSLPGTKTCKFCGVQRAVKKRGKG